MHNSAHLPPRPQLGRRNRPAPGLSFSGMRGAGEVEQLPQVSRYARGSQGQSLAPTEPPCRRTSFQQSQWPDSRSKARVFLYLMIANGSRDLQLADCVKI